MREVRDYFGERIALYFLFMSHFIKWMIIPTVFGTFLCVRISKEWNDIGVVEVVDLFYGTPNNVTSVLICLGAPSRPLF